MTLPSKERSDSNVSTRVGHNVVLLRFAQCTGLYPVYDLPRQVALRYVGTQVPV